MKMIDGKMFAHFCLNEFSEDDPDYLYLGKLPVKNLWIPVSRELQSLLEREFDEIHRLDYHCERGVIPYLVVNNKHHVLAVGNGKWYRSKRYHSL